MREFAKFISIPLNMKLLLRDQYEAEKLFLSSTPRRTETRCDTIQCFRFEFKLYGLENRICDFFQAERIQYILKLKSLIDGMSLRFDLYIYIDSMGRRIRHVLCPCDCPLSSLKWKSSGYKTFF
uniref:Uncharacterized protein n=1 Tax=Lepeophtheirus salmonis TaxID=72036 RepID=A0A0K2U1S0_LEPSM